MDVERQGHRAPPELLAQATEGAVAPLTPGGNEDFSVEPEMSGRVYPNVPGKTDQKLRGIL